MSSFPVPAEQEKLIRAVLRSIFADHYPEESNPHADAESEYAAERVAIAARDLTDAVNALAPDRRPIGWHKLGDPKPAEAAKPVNLTQLLDLIEALTDSGECRFDHHGGCQEHGYLSLESGEKCPHAEAKELLANRPATITTEPAMTWTGPDGTVYDLGHGLRDKEGDVWVCTGWFQPFDGDPVPVVEWNGDRHQLPEVITMYGPLTKRAED